MDDKKRLSELALRASFTGRAQFTHFLEPAAVTERAASDAAAAKAELDELKSSIESYRAACRKLIEDQLQTLKANDLLFK